MTTVKTFTIVQELDAKGYLSFLMKSGLISPKIYFYSDVFTRYTELIKKKDDIDARNELAEYFNCNERTIRNALKFMNTEVVGKN